MKVIALTLLLLVFPQDAPRTSSQYDRFKDVTTIASEYEHVRFSNARDVRFVQFRCVVTHKGQTLKVPPVKMTFGFMVTSYEWQFKHSQRPSLIILVNGKNILDGNAETLDSRASAGYVVEVQAVELERDIVKQMANAKTVEIQIGTLELSLTSANQQTLRDLIAKSQP